MPGSPLIAERTVELLRADDRVDVTVVPALSFLDLAWERLGLDPIPKACGWSMPSSSAPRPVVSGARSGGAVLVANAALRHQALGR